MKIKAIIFREDRTNDVIVLKKKQMSGNTFRHEDRVYFLDADRCQTTWTKWLGLVKKYFSTYYYTYGVPYPLDVPKFGRIERVKLDAEGKPVYGENGKPEVITVFPKTVDQGVSNEELAALFNPWFYRTIAPPLNQLKADIQFYLVIGIALGVGYIAWQIGVLPDRIIEGVIASGKPAT